MNEKPPYKLPWLVWMAGVSQFFQFEKLGTNWKTEILASFTIFFTIAPFLVTNAKILSTVIFLHQPGDLFPQLLTAVALTCAIASTLFGLATNYPVFVGPAPGLSAFFTFSIVVGMHLDWRLALSAGLLEGVIFTLICVSRFRSRFVQEIPAVIKQAMVAGLGLFITYVALSGDPTPPYLGAGIVVASATTKTTLGSLSEPATFIAVVGLLLTAMLIVRKVKGAMLLSVLLTASLGWLIGIAPTPQGLLSLPYLPVDLVGQAITGFKYLTWQQAGNFIAAVFMLLFVFFSDRVGALTALEQQLGRLDQVGTSNRANQALTANAVGTTVGSLLGNPPAIPYLESVTGIAEGGRSGLVPLLVTFLTLLSVFFTPLFVAVPSFAITPSLVIIGVLMLGVVRYIHWDDLSEAIPAFLMIVTMPLTFSIANGLAIGFIAYPLMKSARGRMNEVSLTIIILALLSLLYFVLITLRV